MPVKTIALTAGSLSMSVRASSISRYMPLLIAFSTSGRFRVIVPMPSAFSTMMFFVVQAALRPRVGAIIYREVIRVRSTAWLPQPEPRRGQRQGPTCDRI